MERLQSGKAKKTLVPEWGVQPISKAASWKSRKDLSDIHLKYVAKQSQSREQTSSILVQSVANTEVMQSKIQHSILSRKEFLSSYFKVA